MVEEPVEAVKIKKIGILSFAGTLTIANLLLTALILLIAFIFFGSQISSSNLLSLLPLQTLSLPVFLILFLGYGLLTFISSIIAGLFYNLASLMTRGIKLYS